MSDEDPKCAACGKKIERYSGRWLYFQPAPWKDRMYYCDDRCLPGWAK